jgi:hypothetical protein
MDVMTNALIENDIFEYRVGPEPVKFNEEESDYSDVDTYDMYLHERRQELTEL